MDIKLLPLPPCPNTPLGLPTHRGHPKQLHPRALKACLRHRHFPTFVSTTRRSCLCDRPERMPPAGGEGPDTKLLQAVPDMSRPHPVATNSDCQTPGQQRHKWRKEVGGEEGKETLPSSSCLPPPCPPYPSGGNPCWSAPVLASRTRPWHLSSGHIPPALGQVSSSLTCATNPLH